MANFDAQVGQTLHVLDHLAVCHPMVSGYEADDTLGTLATLAAARGLRATITAPVIGTCFGSSGRRSLSSCPGAATARRLPRVSCRSDGAFHPDRFADLKALIGDPSDRIPGVPGIGPRTAAALLTQRGDLDGLYAAIASLPARQAVLLETYKDRVWLNRRLVTIVRTLDLPAGPSIRTAGPARSSGRPQRCSQAAELRD